MRKAVQGWGCTFSSVLWLFPSDGRIVRLGGLGTHRWTLPLRNGAFPRSARPFLSILTRTGSSPSSTAVEGDGMEKWLKHGWQQKAKRFAADGAAALGRLGADFWWKRLGYRMDHSRRVLRGNGRREEEESNQQQDQCLLGAAGMAATVAGGGDIRDSSSWGGRRSQWTGDGLWAVLPTAVVLSWPWPRGAYSAAARVGEWMSEERQGRGRRLQTVALPEGQRMDGRHPRERRGP